MAKSNIVKTKVIHYLNDALKILDTSIDKLIIEQLAIL